VRPGAGQAGSEERTDQRVVERTRTRRQTFQERRRVARGLPPRPDPSERPATNDDDAGDLEGIEV